MKTAIAVPFLLILASVSSAAAAVELPSQKPGLWKMTVKGPDMPAGVRSFQMCEDAAFIASAKASAAAHLKTNCTATSSVRKQGDTWISDSDCTLSGMHIISHSVTTMHGDELFHTEATSTTVTAKGAKKTSVMTVDNQFMGACKAGQKVGVPQIGK